MHISQNLRTVLEVEEIQNLLQEKQCQRPMKAPTQTRPRSYPEALKKGQLTMALQSSKTEAICSQNRTYFLSLANEEYRKKTRLLGTLATN